MILKQEKWKQPIFVVYFQYQSNGEIFYVGIGTVQRPYNTNKRNKDWKQIFISNNEKITIKIIHEKLTWSEVCKLETHYIQLYGRKDLNLGPLVNKTNGGESNNAGYIHTTETKEKQRQAKLGTRQSERTKQKRGDAMRGDKHYMFGKHPSEDTREKQSQAKKGEKNVNFGKKMSKERVDKTAKGNRKVGVRKNSKSNYKGVSWIESKKAYIVRAFLDGKLRYIGRFEDETEGARAYDGFIRFYFGEEAYLNFPMETIPYAPKITKPKLALEVCIADAKRFETLSEWRTQSPNVYNAVCRRDGWLEQCKAELKVTRHGSGYWTKERCVESVKPYEFRSDWQYAVPGAYAAARKNGWIEECYLEMEPKINPNGYWSKEKVVQDAFNYGNASSWSINSPSAYDAARELGCLSECKFDLSKKKMEERKPNGYWTLEICQSESEKYFTAKEWKSNNNSSYSTASRKGWLPLCKLKKASPQ